MEKRPEYIGSGRVYIFHIWGILQGLRDMILGLKKTILQWVCVWEMPSTIKKFKISRWPCFLMLNQDGYPKATVMQGCLGGSVGWVSDFGSGHDLPVRGFKPCVGNCADSSEPGACFGFCVFFSLPLPCLLSVSLSLKNNKTLKKKKSYSDSRAVKGTISQQRFLTESTLSCEAACFPSPVRLR